MANTFGRFTQKVLVQHLGDSGEDLFIRAHAKKPLRENASPEEVADFIRLTEKLVSIIAPKETASEIIHILKTRASELRKRDAEDRTRRTSAPLQEGKAAEVEMLTRSINDEIAGFLHGLKSPQPASQAGQVAGAKPGVSPVQDAEPAESKPPECAQPESVQTDVPQLAGAVLTANIDAEIEVFLQKFPLPNEVDITDFAKYLTFKYEKDTRQIEKEIVDRVRDEIKAVISRSKIQNEIQEFLTKYPQPRDDDIDDFIRYLKILKLSFREEDIRSQVERERLYRKFNVPKKKMAPTITTDIDKLIQRFKSVDKESIRDVMMQQGLGYLIQNESGGESVNDFVELVSPDASEVKNMLEGLGLKHLVRDKEEQ
ncbi:MAG TPA: hypothetical protein HA257_06450 [Candidatus Methanoperedenaceae archaeon]|nr:hypothetical protein [Candidatus Methanoperedenaceae archaeon]